MNVYIINRVSLLWNDRNGITYLSEVIGGISLSCIDGMKSIILLKNWSSYVSVIINWHNLDVYASF